MPRSRRRSSTVDRIASAFELVPRSEEHSFTLREFKSPEFPSPWHFHPEYELTCILGSRGTRFVGDSIARYEPGDLVLLGPNVPHCWRNDTTGRDARCPAHSLVIQFREDCLGREFFHLPEMAAVRQLLRRARRGVQFIGKPCESVTAVMTRMRQQAAGVSRVIQLLEIFGVLSAASSARPLSSAGFVPDLDDQAGERIGRVCRYVLRHLSERLDFRRLANESCMSQSALCHYFKRATGRTLSDFVNELRIGHARRLLIETTLGVAQIAYASGFANLSNFNHRFRRLSGVSPSVFREKHRNAARRGPGDSTRPCR